MNYSDLNNFENLQFIPVNANKKPVPAGWQKNARKYDLNGSPAVGLVCGKLSANESGASLEAIDLDIKYDLTGKLFERYKRLINEVDKDLLRKLVVQKTKNGGYHFIYRCEKVEGNLKLANRPTTKEEKEQTYKEVLEAETKKNIERKRNNEPELTKEEVEQLAANAAKNDKVRVLIETRGEGGQIVCYPTPGYEIIYGDFYGINEITIDQRETLFNIARQFNKLVEEYRPQISEIKKQKGLSAFEDYNDRGDVVALLEKHGWKIVRRKGSKTVLLRPGQTSSATSGDYDHDKKWFAVFTTSTQFEPQKAYLPYAVFAILECGGNFSEASKKLYDLGYGDRMEKQKELNQKTPSKISLIDGDFSFVAKPEDYDDYLHQAKEGTLPVGLTTGMPSLDKHFLFKPGAFVIINGIDNVGKTSVILFLCLLSALLHKWSWIIYCAENSVGYCIRKMMEFYWNKPIRKMNDLEFKISKQFVESHFTFIKSEEDLYNYKDILLMSKKLMNRKKYEAILIDPYNALKIELTNASKLSTHEYHYEAISEIKQFTKNTGIAFYINTHAITAASRLKSDDGKGVPAPQKADVEGGQKFGNKSDDFLTIHRNVQHETDWMVTEIHVMKIKETETGGKVTPQNMPVKIKMMKGGCAFCEDGIGMEESPIEVWHRKNRLIQKALIPDLEDKPYANDYLNNLGESENPF